MYQNSNARLGYRAVTWVPLADPHKRGMGAIGQWIIQVATLKAAYKFIEALHGITLDNSSWCADFGVFQ